ncbi:MAG: hypothetical protein Q9211_001460 [Gyalolechia sp. 1 TL-2023]
MDALNDICNDRGEGLKWMILAGQTEMPDRTRLCERLAMRYYDAGLCDRSRKEASSQLREMRGKKATTTRTVHKQIKLEETTEGMKQAE